VTCTADDVAGNTAECLFTVTVADTEKPSVSCPANIVVPNDAGVCTATVSYTFTDSDNCPGVTTSCTPASGSTFQTGTTAVTCTAHDTAGNEATCSFTVTVNEAEAPTVTCPSNVAVSTDAGQCLAIVTFAPTAADNCPGTTTDCVPPSGFAFPKGSTTVT